MLRKRPAPEMVGLRLRLMAGSAFLAMGASALPALAQDAAPPQPGPDGLIEGAAYIEADTVTREGDIVSAVGTLDRRALGRFSGSTLRARQFNYDLGLGVASADG